MREFCWSLVIVGAILAMLQMGLAFFHEDSSPKQAASAAFALCLAVVPYVLARAVSELEQMPNAKLVSTVNRPVDSEEVLDELEEIEQWLEDESTPSS